jgi:arylsulfatase A-like enzyme
MTIHRPVRTVDIAPTLAALLGVRPEGRLDGEPLVEVVGGR